MIGYVETMLRIPGEGEKHGVWRSEKLAFGDLNRDFTPEQEAEIIAAFKAKDFRGWVHLLVDVLFDEMNPDEFNGRVVVDAGAPYPDAEVEVAMLRLLAKRHPGRIEP